MTPVSDDADRRRSDRRGDFVSLAEYTVPELRKAFLTFSVLLVALVAFFYMVRHVIVAVIAGIVVGAYLIPFRGWLAKHIRSTRLTAIISILVVMVPMIAILTYSWLEISGAAAYLNEHDQEVVSGLSRGLDRVPFGRRINLDDQLPRW